MNVKQRTPINCAAMPQPGTVLAIQTEADAPYVWATYSNMERVPASVLRLSDYLVIRADQALRLFGFVEHHGLNAVGERPPAHSSRKGGVAVHANRRREAAAREVIADVRSVGEHGDCDPAIPSSLCGECAALLSEAQA